jgi:hypothetical protein
VTGTAKQADEMRLDVSAPGSLLSRLALMLQSGFQVRVLLGGSVRELLCNQLELPSDYVEDRIRTLFLDGRPVDDMDRAIVEDGSVLGLSGALPGLVGATMRRGGYYGCLRDSITYRPATAILPEKPESAVGIITIKLFNLVLKDLGPHFLSRGVLLPANAVESFLHDQPGDIWDANVTIRIDGERIAAPTAPQQPWPRLAGTIRLRVNAAAND